MGLNDQATLYDVLDLKPDASPQEVREAYLRTKAAYNKDSVALYTLISPEEREEMLRLIEEAYAVLSSADKRKEYDRYHGLLSSEEEMLARSRPSPGQKIISIDRVPPMETGGGEDLLVPPSTDFTAPRQDGAARGAGFFSSGEAPLSAFHSAGASTPPPAPRSAPVSPPAPPQPAQPLAESLGPGPASPQPVAQPPASAPPQRRAAPQVDTGLTQEIAKEVDWQGLFLRKVREARRISIEEMSAVTKVSKTYLMAIEEENYGKLPAPVFLRGFIIQIAKVLKLPHEQVAAAYMARYHSARKGKEA